MTSNRVLVRPEESARDENENRSVVERLIRCINDRKIEVMDELFHDDAVMDWPQSGEKVVGAANRRAVYSAGDLVIAEARLDHDGPVYPTVFIFELRDGKIARETAYWAEAFDAPEWRARWVTRDDG